MAFNQASFFLFAPGFRPAVEFDHSTKTASGKPLEIISTSPVDSTAPQVFTESLRRWFMDRGFAEKERYGGLQVLCRGPQTTFLGTQEQIVLSLPLDETVIQELYIRFLLTEQTPEHVAHWRDLIVELGHDFGFQILDALHQSIAFYKAHGITIHSILTDQGSSYRSKLFAAACKNLGLRHLFTRPYRPQTNGKAERFIQTLTREWAYARPYDSSHHRAQFLPLFLHDYNFHRPHSALNALPPSSRLPKTADNVSRYNS